MILLILFTSMTMMINMEDKLLSLARPVGQTPQQEQQGKMKADKLQQNTRRLHGTIVAAKAPPFTQWSWRN